MFTSYYDIYLIFMHVGTKWYFITLQFSLSVQEHSRSLGEDFF